MIFGMFLAHLVGDYVLQWDSLAIRKSKDLTGALTHGAIVTAVTLLFAVVIDPAWWPWALAIGFVHTAIDAGWLLNRRLPADKQLKPLPRFIIDQVLHAATILAALVLSGYTSLPTLPQSLLTEIHRYPMLAMVVGYVAVSMPAWVVVEFMVYGLVRAPAPDFSPSANKYLGIVERGLITTFVLLGQFALVPLVAVPRLVFDGPRVMGSQRSMPYLTEILVSVALAIGIGLVLRALV
jgi:hypothetical protein